MNRNIYIVHLIGMGDEQCCAVDKEVYDWIISPWPDGADESTTEDLNIPQVLMDAKQAQLLHYPDEDVYMQNLTIESRDNDRALFVISTIPDYKDMYWDLGELVDDIHSKKDRTMRTYVGYIY